MRQATAAPDRLAGPMRLAMIALVATSLLSGVAGGLLRAGVPLGTLGNSTWAAQATGLHAALMIGGFLGTVIGIERAVALHRPWAFAAPLASAAAGVCLLLGNVSGATALFIGASLVFVAVNVVVVRRQSALHTWLLLLSALVWLGGNVRFMQIGVQDSTLSAWFGFLVLTIAAERLEMARLVRQHPYAKPFLMLTLTMMITGIVLADWMSASMAGLVYGVSLLMLAMWLCLFDIARHTVRASGLSRYMAICLLSGYAWLAVAGVCWAAYTAGHGWRDAALHALGLGFIFSMVMGHAPVILPAVARIKLHFDGRFYVPWLLLHLSLLIRLGPGTVSPAWRASGSALNAASIALFALTVISAALTWRKQHPTAPSHTRITRGHP